METSDQEPALSLDHARATILRGCDFLERSLAGTARGTDLTPTWQHARLVGNHLRELDAFLSVALDRAMGALGGSDAERRRFRQRRNTHLKLLDLAMPGSADEDAGLCAVGVVRDCLHRHGGSIATLKRGSVARTTMVLDMRVSNDRLAIGRDTLLTVTGLYRSACARIVGTAAIGRGAIDLSVLHRHVACRNIACDET